MLKKSLLMLAAFSLTACELHPVTGKTALCDQAKRQQIMNENSRSENAMYLTPEQKNKLTESVKTNC